MNLAQYLTAFLYVVAIVAVWIVLLDDRSEP